MGCPRAAVARVALVAALLLGAAAASPAAAAADDTPDVSLHTVYGAECSNYMDWQSVAVVYSHRKAGVPGPITRLLTCSAESLAGYTNLDLVPTHLAPSWTFNSHNNDTYQAYNKPGAIMHWLTEAPPKETWVLVLDPDMIIRDSFEGWGSQYGAGRGWAVSVYFHYMKGVANNLSLVHVPEIPPRQDALAGPVGRRGDQASAVVLMHRDDLTVVAPRWLHYSEVVRDDPMAWNETGDEYADRPGRKPWIAEMYGYSFGASTAGVWHRLDHAAMLYPGYSPIDKPLVLHYGRMFDIGSHYRWQKHWLHAFKALQCPPWPHLALNMTGQEMAGSVTGGLFIHPPHPSTFDSLPATERYKELLSLSVIATLNAALCERHLVNCPPSEELREQCGKAQQLERDTDAALLALERSGPPDGQPLCRDLKPADQCRGWFERDLCWQDPRFMDYWCRDTCGLCRLPAGRPLLPFGWEKQPHRDGGEASGSLDTLPAGRGKTHWQPGGRHGRSAGGAAAGHARLEWHALHAGQGSSEVRGGGLVLHHSIGRDMEALLLHGLAAWCLLAVAAAAAAISSIWAWRKSRRGHAGPRALAAVLGRRPDRHSSDGSASGVSGRSTPLQPLLGSASAHNMV